MDEPSGGLQIMGSAGFKRWPDFFDRLMRCRDNGASLKMLEAIERRQAVVVPDRWAAIQQDPAWAPLHEYLGEQRWGWFASVPLIIRSRAAGVLNAFFAPGQRVGHATMEFLVAMAEQAAMAVDYASLLLNAREVARRDERQRLARDLHDSIVQEVFSIGMQAKSLAVLSTRGDTVPAESVRRIADEVGTSTRTVLTDLRAMVHQLRPSAATELGLEEAVRALVESTTNRTGLRFTLVAGPGLGDIQPDMTEDLYRIVAESIHNIVKHADASRATVRMSVRDNAVKVVVGDNGCGITSAEPQAGDVDSGGYGLTTMRERAERWGGRFKIQRRPGRTGTVVTVTIPPSISTPAETDRGVAASASHHLQEDRAP